MNSNVIILIVVIQILLSFAVSNIVKISASLGELDRSVLSPLHTTPVYQEPKLYLLRGFY